MARIRTIKPEFFTSEDVVVMSPLARLFFQACWCEADREGRLEWKPRTMKLRYFPADDCDITEVANEVLTQGIVKLYEADGRQYAHIPSFLRHQHVNPREAASMLPDPHESSHGIAEQMRADEAPARVDEAPERVNDASARVNDASARVNDASSRVDDAQGGKEGKGKEGKEDSDASHQAAATAAPHPDPVDARTAVWREGLGILRSLTGRPDGPSRAFLGRLLKAAGDNCDAVLQILHEAGSLRPVDPEAWLTQAAQSRGRRAETGISPRRERILRAGGLWPEDGQILDHEPKPVELLQ